MLNGTYAINIHEYKEVKHNFFFFEIFLTSALRFSDSEPGHGFPYSAPYCFARKLEEEKNWFTSCLE